MNHAKTIGRGQQKRVTILKHDFIAGALRNASPAQGYSEIKFVIVARASGRTVPESAELRGENTELRIRPLREVENKRGVRERLQRQDRLTPVQQTQRARRIERPGGEA